VPTTIDLTGFLDSVHHITLAHKRPEPGAFARWSVAGEAGTPPNPYGCADAVNLLYTLGKLPAPPAEREAMAEALRNLQSPEDGLFHESTHHPVHTTAHCIGALEILDARPRHPLVALAGLKTPDGLTSYLDGLEWGSNPWRESHRGAGFYAALAVAEWPGSEWEEAYFGWLERETDPRTGLVRRHHLAPVEHSGVATLMPHLAGTFHYLFNVENAARPWPHAEALVNTCLEIMEERLFPFSTRVAYAELDWVYALNRAVRQTGHRRNEAQQALRRFAFEYVDFLTSLDPATDEGLNDLHMLLGAVSALTELQRAVPGLIRSYPALRLVLDRRPFI
jgi:hypothetical protein